MPEYLIATGADVNTVNGGDMTPLHLSSMNGHGQCVNVLIAAGADMNAVNNERKTALHLCASNGHADCMELLLRAGAEKNMKYSRFGTALVCALQSKKELNITCFELLLQAEPDEGKVSIPSFVLVQRDIPNIKLLIDAALRVDPVFDDNYTLLRLAVQHGNVNAVEQLITRGASVNTTYCTKTVLAWALYHNQKSCVDYLISAGADVNTALSDVVLRGLRGDVSMIKKLLKARALVNTNDKIEKPPQSLANDCYTTLVRTTENGCLKRRHRKLSV